MGCNLSTAAVAVSSVEGERLQWLAGSGGSVRRRTPLGGGRVGPFGVLAISKYVAWACKQGTSFLILILNESIFSVRTNKRNANSEPRKRTILNSKP
eukprot:scaffold49995_cov32-Tisochrysis_lutea.AAC.2